MQLLWIVLNINLIFLREINMFLIVQSRIFYHLNRFKELATMHFCHHLAAHWHASRPLSSLFIVNLALVLSVLVSIPSLEF
jgi:hypothetical protein